MNGVQPTPGTTMRVQLVRPSPLMAGETEASRQAEPMWDVLALGDGFEDLEASRLKFETMEALLLAAKFPVSRVPQAALSAIQPLPAHTLSVRLDNLSKINTGLQGYMSNLPAYVNQVAAQAAVEAVGLEFDALTNSMGGTPSKQGGGGGAREESLGESSRKPTASKRSGEDLTPPRQVKKAKARPATHLVARRDVVLEAGQSVTVGVFETK